MKENQRGLQLSRGRKAMLGQSPKMDVKVVTIAWRKFDWRPPVKTARRGNSKHITPAYWAPTKGNQGP